MPTHNTEDEILKEAGQCFARGTDKYWTKKLGTPPKKQGAHKDVVLNHQVVVPSYLAAIWKMELEEFYRGFVDVYIKGKIFPDEE